MLSSTTCSACEVGQKAARTGSMGCNSEAALAAATAALQIEYDLLIQERDLSQRKTTLINQTCRNEKTILELDIRILQNNITTLLSNNLLLESHKLTLLQEKTKLESDTLILQGDKNSLIVKRDELETKIGSMEDQLILAGEHKQIMKDQIARLLLQSAYHNTSWLNERELLEHEQVNLLDKLVVAEANATAAQEEINTLETEQERLQMNMTQIGKQIIDLKTEMVVVKQKDVNSRSKPTSTDGKTKSNSTCECEHSDSDKMSATGSKEAPNLSLYLMAATVGMITNLCIIYFLFCCCRKNNTNPIPHLAVPVKKGKLRIFMDQNHDKITQVAHRDHAKSVQNISRAHSKAKVKIIQKKQDNAKSRLQTRLQMRANMNNNATRDEKREKKVKATKVEIVIELDKKDAAKHQAKKLAKEKRKAKKMALKAQLLLERRHAKEKDSVITETEEMKKLTRTTSVI